MERARLLHLLCGCPQRSSRPLPVPAYVVVRAHGAQPTKIGFENASRVVQSRQRWKGDSLEGGMACNSKR